MKKIINIIALIILINFKLNAQQPPCENGCTVVTTGTFTDEICHHTWSGLIGGINYTFDGPSVFVMVNYTIMNCNGVQSLQIDGTVLFDNRNYWTYEVANPDYTPNQGTACVYPTDIKQAQINAVSRLVNNLGIPASVPVFFKGSCNSTVTIRWPGGAYMIFPPNGDNPSGGPTRVDLSNSTTTVSIPCNDACCKVIYEYKIRNTEEGLTEHYYEPTILPVDGSCASSPQPDYNSYPHKLEAKLIDPVTGNETIVYGSIEGQETCELICNKYSAPQPPDCFTTGVDKANKPIPLEFSANPTVINDFIKINSNKIIDKIVVYNLAGKKEITVTKPENNELKTSELKEGIYFIQIYFTDNQVKTVKVVKP